MDNVFQIRTKSYTNSFNGMLSFLSFLNNLSKLKKQGHGYSFTAVLGNPVRVETCLLRKIGFQRREWWELLEKIHDFQFSLCLLFQVN